LIYKSWFFPVFLSWKPNKKSHRITHDLSRRSSLRREIPQKVDAQINSANWSRSPFALRFGAALFRRTRSASSLSITLTATVLGVAFSQQQATARLALSSAPLATLQTLPQLDISLSSPIQRTVWRVQEVSSPQAPAAFSTTPNLLTPLSVSSDSSPFQSKMIGAEPSRMVSTSHAIDSLAAVVEPEPGQFLMSLENKVILNANDAPQAVGAVVHTVEKGENLTEIAGKYRVSLDSIAQTNRIPNPNVIDINEDLVIPASTLSVAASSIIATALTQDMVSKPVGTNLQAQPVALAPKQDSSTMEYAPSASQIARRSILQIPPLELPPLSSAEQFLPSMLQNGIQKFIWPANGVFTSGYGWRWGRMHRGIDIAAPVGTPVVASASGVVISAGWNEGGYGNLVEIRHPDGSVTRYAHNQAMFTRTGAVVNQGELIAHMGSTGRSTGPHTHFEIHPGGRGSVDPMFFLSRK
jgi:murein DD-endopeptidase MepM/ murein hydrolase activator NlpD